MRRWLAAALVLACGCAQIESRSTIDVVPRPELEPKWLGEAKTVVGRDLSLAWSQSLSTVEIRVEEARRCRAVLHEPVDRVETIDRSVKHGALYWEYGVGAALLAVGLAALIKPEAFSNRTLDENGNTSRDTATGYRLGGIFTALGAGVAGIGVYDTVRSRDSVTTTRAYRITSGDETPCISPRGPKTDIEVELSIGPWTSKAKTDNEGRARFGLPPERELGIELPFAVPVPTPVPVPADPPAPPESTAPDPEPAPDPAPTPEPIEATATVRIAGQTATFTIMAPLSSAGDRSGTATLTPEGPPRPSAAAP